jgi:DNA-binding XRE family transcriptional regulator/predicted RNase H-like HicB family nuclease
MCVKFEGNVSKGVKYWPVEAPSLYIFTQGKSKRDALFMIKEAIELCVNVVGFEVEIVPLKNDKFIVMAKKNADDKYLVALMLKQQRAKFGLSTSEVAKRLKITKHAYAQYEQARSLPSLTKIEEFIHAMSKTTHVVVNVFDEPKAA